ncbi:MAG: hypothetical protein AAF690_00565 [Acidobacteriota bacterium]
MPSLLLLLVLFPSDALSANSLDVFRRAVEALQSGAWREAQLLAEGAIAEQRFAQPDVVTTEALGPIPYTPHLVLGLALYEQGDCEAAERSLEFARAQGVAERTGSTLWPRGLRALTVCRSSDLQAARQAFRDLEDSVQQTLIEWRRLADDDLASEKLAERPDLIDRVRRAEARLRTARETAEDADSGTREIDESRQMVEGIGEQLEAAVAELKQDIGVTLAGRVAQTAASLDLIDATVEELRETYPSSVRALERRAFDDLSRSVRQARARLESEGDAAAALADASRLAASARASAEELRQRLALLDQSRAYDQERNALRGRLRRAASRRQRLADPIGEAERRRVITVDRRLQQIEQDLEQATEMTELAPARERLTEAEAVLLELETAGGGGDVEEAAASYLRGDYARALQLLTVDGRCSTDSEGRRGLRVCVLEAATSLALLRSGATSDASESRLAELLELIRGIDPGYRPSTSYFSPAFRALFETAKAR